ncbi:MAG: FtsW/RodA/SpoVE family cell cycle protein [Oscillospiraceae bacterium]|nr:FtsW/RodA/SpoVE family cell cycle protein [Oscillospiraceae bacterium]
MKQILTALKKYILAADKMLLLAVMSCSAISCIMLYSIASNGLVDKVDYGDFRTQLIASILGLCVAGVLTIIDYNRIIRLWWLYAPIALGLVLLTFTSLGYRRAGADDQAWLSIAGFQLQPSELLKLAFILSFSYHLSKDEENMNKLPHMLLLCLHAVVPIGLVALQGDYGTAIVFAFIFMAEILTARIALRYIIAAAIAIPAACIVAWNFLLSDMHKSRILVLIHPGTDPLGLEYQQDLGLAALANGGIFGKGLFGTEGYVSVPEMHNDLIFSYIGQVWGLIGALLVLALLTFIVLRTLTNMLSCKNAQGRYICVGTFGMLFAHCLINLGMVLKVMPVIGVPLPFMSAGGTAVVCMYVAIGLVNSTRCHNTRKYRVFYDAEPEN